MTVQILRGDCRDILRTLPDESVHCVVTSPPYWGLRDYGVSGQLGLEASYEEFIEGMVAIFAEARRVLRPDGTAWLNLGDSYHNGDKGGYAKDRVKAEDSLQRSNLGANFIGAPNRQPQSGLKPKDLTGIPWRVAFALQADGWYLRQDIIWSKPNPTPESVRDRCTKAHEYIFLLSKSERYYFDQDAIREPFAYSGDVRVNTRYAEETGKKPTREYRASLETDGRNKRSVWEVTPQPFSDWGETVRRVRVEADAPHDGKKRTTSPDCPLHGDRRHAVATASYGERVASHPRRTQHNESHPDLMRSADCGPIETRPAPETVQHNLDLPDPSCSASATSHNNQSHKTDRAPVTSPACSVSAQTQSHILDTSGEHETSDLAEHKHESNSDESAGKDDSQASQTPSRSARKSTVSVSSSACTCEYYVEIVDKTSHFATFPPALIEPCVLAGCPEGGTVLDPFGGAGTTGLVADRLKRNAILIELNPTYADMAERRIKNDAGMFADVC